MCYNDGALGHLGDIFFGFDFYNLGVARFQLLTWIAMLTLLLMLLVFHLFFTKWKSFWLGKKKSTWRRTWSPPYLTRAAWAKGLTAHLLMLNQSLRLTLRLLPVKNNGRKIIYCWYFSLCLVFLGVYSVYLLSIPFLAFIWISSVSFET